MNILFPMDPDGPKPATSEEIEVVSLIVDLYKKQHDINVFTCLTPGQIAEIAGWVTTLAMKMEGIHIEKKR